MKIGLELEYWITDEQGKLTSSKEISKELKFAEQEFVEPVLEIKSKPHSSIKEMQEELIKKLRKVIETADKFNQHVVPLGTPLNSEEIEKVPSKRGRIQEEIIGTNFEAAKRVAGTHIHFEKTQVVEQINSVIALDPALALMNSSPYYRGNKIASSSRNKSYRYKCYEKFPKHGQLWKYADSTDEWKKRRKKRFREFKKAAKQNGIEEDIFLKHFSPEDTIWTPVRLREKFPTVEYRSPDPSTLSQTLRMAKESKNVVEDILDGGKEKPEYNRVVELSQKAISYGLESKDVREYLENLGFSVQNYENYSKQISSSINKKNIQKNDAQKLRLKYSQKLCEDIERKTF